MPPATITSKKSRTLHKKRPNEPLPNTYINTKPTLSQQKTPPRYPTFFTSCIVLSHTHRPIPIPLHTLSYIQYFYIPAFFSSSSPRYPDRLSVSLLARCSSQLTPKALEVFASAYRETNERTERVKVAAGELVALLIK